MSENIAEPNHAPGQALRTLYGRWRDGGVGLCISGNVMVDSRYLGEPDNVVIEQGAPHLEALRQWASVKQDSAMKFWLQLNHPGKQIPKYLCAAPLAPSAIPLRPPLDKMFNVPREMSESDIRDVIARFAFAAKTAREAGFDGVQIHAAHGYLVSQFLSPHHNRRTDAWGGSLENRMRFVVEIYRAMRAAAGSDFAVGIKLNSADFQKGGFSHEDSIAVAKKLSDLGIDLVEVSGGSYEAPTMMGESARASTKRREAYFLEYARDVKRGVSCPVMVTGGFRTSAFMQATLASGDVDLIGLARPLAIEPDLPNRLLSNQDVTSAVRPLTTGFGFLDKLVPLEIVWYSQQLKRMGAGREPDPKRGVYGTVVSTIGTVGLESLKRVRGI